MKVVALFLALLASASAQFGKKGRPPLIPEYPPPSSEEMAQAYDMAAKRILAMSKYPPSVKMATLESSWFVVESQVNGNSVIKAFIVFDGQNGFGAMTRGTALCRVNIAKNVVLCDGLTFDMVAMGMIPAHAVRGGASPASIPAAAAERAETAKAQPLSVKSDALVSISVKSTPADAIVEVDGYPAGKTPVDVKLQKGEYTIKVSKNGFQTYSQKITVEAGKSQTLGIALAPIASDASKPDSTHVALPSGKPEK